MIELYSERYTKHHLLKHMGSLSQIAGIRELAFSSGKSRGMRLLEVHTGTGFGFSVLPDRCLDIAWANYRQYPLAYMSKADIPSPQYYDPAGTGWLRSFPGGLLSTCGLTYYGSPCDDEGVELGLHGRANNLPAEHVCVSQEWIGEEFVMTIKGEMRQSALFGENVLLKRQIQTHLGARKVQILDVVENQGYEPVPVMMLYHCNIGFPILNAGSVLLETANAKIAPLSSDIPPGEYNAFQPPTPGFREQCYIHDMAADADGYTSLGLYNPKLENGLGVYVKGRKAELPLFTEWKMLGEAEYVVGLEPCTNTPQGRAQARKDGSLQFLEPGESKSFSLEIGMIIGQ